MAEKRSSSKVKKRAPSTGVVAVLATFNNTIISVTTMNGDTVSQGSGGSGGDQKGSRKATAYAAEQGAKRAGGIAKDRGMFEVHVRLNGAGAGREAAVRGIAGSGLKILSITECTKVPHNGARRRKEKRN
ncbi:30S ribosomal protein S11 [Gammaproteobacteria bacterium]|nr:30S ribosomal protein S11 [Gammaproteobacteria bacterium]